MGLKNILNIVSTGLDVVGMLPVVGNVASLLNVGVSLAKGDLLGAGLNLLGVIPGVGQAVKGVKLLKNLKNLKYLKNIKNAVGSGFNAIKTLKAAAFQKIVVGARGCLQSIKTGISRMANRFKNWRGGAGNSATGYHATKPEYANSIRSNGFRESASGRAGGGGVYVNNTPEGALAEYAKYNPNGPVPEMIKVQYNPGANVFIENPGAHIKGPLPIFGDSLTFESTQLQGTFNTIVRNGSIKIR